MSSKKIAYATATAITNAIESLATSSTFLGGYESTPVDNSSNLYLDYELAGKITVGTTPTLNTEIRIYIVPVYDGSTYPDVFDGTTSAETVTSAGVRDGFAVLAKVLNVDATTSDRAYHFFIGSIAALFGGIVPAKWAIFTAHNTGVNLNSTGGNHTFYQRGIYSTDA